MPSVLLAAALDLGLSADAAGLSDEQLQLANCAKYTAQFNFLLYYRLQLHLGATYAIGNFQPQKRSNHDLAAGHRLNDLLDSVAKG